MKVTIKNVVLGLAVVFAASTAMGQMPTVTATVTGDGITAVSGTASPANASAIMADDSLTGAWTFDLSLDSSADILVVDATLDVRTGTVFNDLVPAHALNDHAPPNPALLGVPGFETLNTDLWVTTPGSGTSAASSTSLAAGEEVSHFDTSDDGAQTDFRFASITLVPADGQLDATLNATIQTAATPTPLFNEVSVTIATAPIPEPASFGLVITALLGGLGLVRRKRS